MVRCPFSITVRDARMNLTYIAGFPRIGAKRELKFALEKFWRGEIEENEVFSVGEALRRYNRQLQKEAGLDLMTVGDFSYYDHILDAQILVGAIPKRFGFDVAHLNLQQYSELARGNEKQPALEMTKWFDTNYHYLVPEWSEDTQFKAVPKELLRQIEEANKENKPFLPTLIGPLTLLRLGKIKGKPFDLLNLLPQLIQTYQDILHLLTKAGAQSVYLHEPILALDLEDKWLNAFYPTYSALNEVEIRILLGTYFASVKHRIDLLSNLPIQGVHIDLVRAPKQLSAFIDKWQHHPDKILSLGVIDGRNVWKADLRAIYETVKPAVDKLGERVWLSSSCSLLHCPQDLNSEHQLEPSIKSWLAFAVQKLNELTTVKKALNQGIPSVQETFNESDRVVRDRQTNPRIHRQAVQERLRSLPDNADQRKSSFTERKPKQQDRLKLPLLPTTTIGSFPQTADIRKARAQFKRGDLSEENYVAIMKKEIAHIVEEQEKLDLDVLVHGEPERNDMVEYFGEQLDGFAFTEMGWVQSYGSRCVKPPIIYGDVTREKPMTVDWISYAQSLTDQPVKGMLTGPVTVLQWSFVRNDIPRSLTAKQIALAFNDEVLDLEKAGIKIIQIDEPAYREGLPLQSKDWDHYLTWASEAFRLTYSGLQDETQIHTHMCYSEFNDILPAIAAMDADVITIETSRSDKELLEGFVKFHYPNDIGPGVYDIHSPRIPSEEEITRVLQQALQVIPIERLWVNPDCGLKTRAWPEVIASLKNMVAVAKVFRDNQNKRS